MGHVARGVGNIHVGAVLKQVVKTSNEFATLFDRVIDGDMWGAATGWWPACSVHTESRGQSLRFTIALSISWR